MKKSTDKSRSKFLGFLDFGLSEISGTLARSILWSFRAPKTGQLCAPKTGENVKNEIFLKTELSTFGSIF